MEDRNFDVIIVGGSYAGLSAAMTLGRSLRNVLVIDGGQPCNRQTPHSHNFITHDGEKPALIAAKAKEQVLSYSTVKFLDNLAVDGKKTGSGFTITTQTKEEYTSKKLLFATGIKDIMPDIKGFAECWGISVIHCPYCHGYEFRDRKTGIMAKGDNAFHLTSLVKNLTDDITILPSGKPGLTTEQTEKFKAHHIEIVETRISEIEHEKGHLKNLVFEDGRKESFDALYAAVPFTQHSEIPAFLGCELTDEGYIRVDTLQKTTAKGIYACGDSTSMMRSIANAVSAGTMAGAMINHELAEEQFNKWLSPPLTPS